MTKAQLLKLGYSEAEAEFTLHELAKCDQAADDLAEQAFERAIS